MLLLLLQPVKTTIINNPVAKIVASRCLKLMNQSFQDKCGLSLTITIAVPFHTIS